MQNVDIFKGRSLGGTSDLTLLARLKPGFIDSLESVTYKTRTKRVLDALHASRGAAHEYAPARLLSDSIERVAVIQSVRVAVFDDPEQVMLSVSFDGPWESYIRILWQKVGSLLDLIFCGTEDYVLASENTFEAWLGWARRVQVETGFFYGPPSTTARDVVYLRRLERRRARDGADEAFEVGFATPTTEAECAAIGQPAIDQPHRLPVSDKRVEFERGRAGLQGMVALYRLVDLHLPGTPEGRVLLRAAHSLLDEFVALLKDPDLPEAVRKGLLVRFERPLAWLANDPGDPIARPGAPSTSPLPDALRDDVQAGILRGYGRVTHGAVLLLRFDTPKQAARVLEQTGPALTHDLAAGAATAANHDVQVGEVVRNLSFTVAGLRALGLDDADVALLPDEFRQGMKARAGLLGDTHTNHPRRWRRPPRWAATPAAGVAEVPVDVDTVHAVLQLRTCAPDAQALTAYEIADPHHPLAAEIAALAARGDAQVLSVQALRRQYVTPETFTGVREHFGFVDGGGNPDVLGIEPNHPANRVHLGELLLGHANAADADPAPGPADGEPPGRGERRLHWLANGTFLVMRKYRQDVALFYRAAEDAAQASGGTLTRDEVLAKMMGRRFDGTPLANPHANPQNAFDYRGDPQGLACPLHAHVRRANPREPAVTSPPGARTPRIVRRSMSYGRPYNHAQGEDPVNAAPRGLLFMAYNASLGEQFEVVQRWIAAGNSTGGYSGNACPVLGVPEPGHKRSFRFAQGAQVVRMTLDGNDHPFDEADTFTALEWGCYLFVPSFTVLGRLLDTAREAAAAGHVPVPWDTARGAAAIARLPGAAVPAVFASDHNDSNAAVRAWKAALEDADATDRLGVASIWAAVRERHGGVLRTPYGVLVGTRELATHVLRDARERYSVVGQLERMKDCFGEIYLGMDEGPDYWRLSKRINAEIMALGFDTPFGIARQAARNRLAVIQQGANLLAARGGCQRFDSSFDGREVVDEVLADLAEAWFGLENAKDQFKRGGVDWAWTEGAKPSYPGHFTAISRFMFQPHPSETVRRFAERYGQALRAAMAAFVEKVQPSGVLAVAIADDPEYTGQHDLIGRTMVGVLMGFIPTVAGTILNTLREWLTDGTFWRLRAEVLALGRPLTFQDANRMLRPVMEDALAARPMPPQLWRSALVADTLGDGPHAVNVAPGERIIIGTGSCLQQGWVDGQDQDSRLMFGGKRKVTPHPTHACPGYDSAIGSVLGALSAFLELPLQLRSGASALQLVLEGPVSVPAPAPGATPSPVA